MSSSQPQPFALRNPDENRRLPFGPDVKPVASLTETYRPQQLSEMVGQGLVVKRLQDFLDAPHSTAFLFEGPTGVGKTTAALCLAAELGAVEYGGLHRIDSGMQDAEAVATSLDNLRYTPMLGSGWKVVIVDEADYMSPKAQQLWLSALEDLPPRSLIIFTTNKTEKFADRFLDRCERFAFQANGAMLLQDAQALINLIWTREGRTDRAPNVAELPGLLDANKQLSFRRVVRALEPLVRSTRPADPAPSVPETPPPPTNRVRTPATLLNSIDWHAIADEWRGGKSFAEIGRRLGIPSSTVIGRLTRIGVDFGSRT